jgi:hypothetical protein
MNEDATIDECGGLFCTGGDDDDRRLLCGEPRAAHEGADEGEGAGLQGHVEIAVEGGGTLTVERKLA